MSNLYFLRSIPMFKELTAAEINELDKKLESRTYKTNEIIFEENSKGQEMMLIKSGEVEIFKKGDITGTEQVLAVLPQCSIFGEMALIDGAPRSTGARAKSPTELLVISRQSFDALAETNVRAAYKIQKQLLLILSNRLRITDDHYLFTKLTLEKLRDF